MRPLEILYSDPQVLVVFKPPGMPTQADQTGDMDLLETARAWVKQQFNKPGNVFLGMVHRLDRPVGGVVAFARTSKAASRLSEQFRDKTIQKKYIALIEGEMPTPEGELRNFLSSGPQNKMRVADARQGDAQEAILKYRRLNRSHRKFPGCSFLEIELITGRKHQIRAQLSHSGHAIVGDRKYGARTPLKAGRIALMAFHLAFDHPTKPERVVVDVPLSDDWPTGSL